MSGVDQFNSVDQLNKCYEKAQKHVGMIAVMLPAAAAVTILSFITMALESSSLSTLSTIVDYVWLTAIVAFYSVNGTWKYIGKFMAKPWHWHFGIFFVILKLMVCGLFITVGGVVSIMLPIVPYLYGIYLDKKTIANAEAIAAQIQYANAMYAVPNYNQYAAPDYSQNAVPAYNQNAASGSSQYVTSDYSQNTAADYGQNATPAYSQYVASAYNQYATPDYSQYVAPAYNQYAASDYNQYGNQGYGQYQSGNNAQYM